MIKLADFIILRSTSGSTFHLQRDKFRKVTDTSFYFVLLAKQSSSFVYKFLLAFFTFSSPSYSDKNTP